MGNRLSPSRSCGTRTMKLDRPSGGLLLALLLSCGCGLSTYEERLQLTDHRNRYFAKLDSTLDGYWNQPAFGLWLRPPQGMYGVPAPVKPKDAEEPPPDLRQEFQGVPLDLPGIVQAWDGMLPTAGGGTGPYRLYLLSNHSRYMRNEESAGQSNDPKDYFRDLEIVLQNLFGVEIPPGDTGRADENNVKYRVQIPTTPQFVIPKTYQAVNLVPLEEGRQPFQAWLFEYTAGQIQFAVLMLTPPNPSNDVRQALLTSLETLQISAQTPAPSAGGAAGGGGGGGAPTGF